MWHQLINEVLCEVSCTTDSKEGTNRNRKIEILFKQQKKEKSRMFTKANKRKTKKI